MWQADLLREAVGGNELEGFHLAKVCGIPQHVYVHKLCNIAVSVGGVLVLESIPQCCTFLGYDSPLFGCSFALPNLPDQLPA